VLDGAAQQVDGRLIRLRGYVGERVAAMSLRHDAKEVGFPESASQPAYDLMVDEQPFQVKCASDVDVIKEHFLTYPDTPVIANVELADQVDSLPEAMRDQVYFQQGFSVHEVDGITRESVHAGEEMLDFEIPWVALAMAGARTFLRYRAGGTTLSNAVGRLAAPSERQWPPSVKWPG